MERRKPAMCDATKRIKLYAGNDFDPDRYTIWCDGDVRVLMRRPQEGTTELYNRVLESAQAMRRMLPVHIGVFAHIYAGIEPTEAEVLEHLQEPILRTLRFVMANGKTASAQVNAAVRLAELRGFFPPVVKQVEIILR